MKIEKIKQICLGQYKREQNHYKYERKVREKIFQMDQMRVRAQDFCYSSPQRLRDSIQSTQVQLDNGLFVHSTCLKNGG
ncbi:unnamed protein product [Paramecium sonneborni]|uniref:Uncharacterized protein n=1 Tax=Paramecium sonneborni TaxID=65129 RepID=A0A8S1RSF1_9CILI|nr:unnamed protein product [Paramecium sonneborni]